MSVNTLDEWPEWVARRNILERLPIGGDVLCEPDGISDELRYLGLRHRVVRLEGAISVFAGNA